MSRGDCRSVSIHLISVMRKPVFGVSAQARHEVSCTVTENGLRLEILDLERRDFTIWTVAKTKTDKLRVC